MGGRARGTEDGCSRPESLARPTRPIDSTVPSTWGPSVEGMGAGWRSGAEPSCGGGVPSPRRLSRRRSSGGGTPGGRPGSVEGRSRSCSGGARGLAGEAGDCVSNRGGRVPSTSGRAEFPHTAPQDTDSAAHFKWYGRSRSQQLIFSQEAVAPWRGSPGCCSTSSPRPAAPGDDRRRDRRRGEEVLLSGSTPTQSSILVRRRA